VKGDILVLANYGVAAMIIMKCIETGKVALLKHLFAHVYIIAIYDSML